MDVGEDSRTVASTRIIHVFLDPVGCLKGFPPRLLTYRILEFYSRARARKPTSMNSCVLKQARRLNRLHGGNITLKMSLDCVLCPIDHLH